MHQIDLFLDLVRAGLWEQKCYLKEAGNIDFNGLYKLATEQSLLGLILAGFEHSDLTLPKEMLWQWIGDVQMIEQRNTEMNAFVAKLMENLNNAGVYALLVKGQGIAQCYERPKWRASGDVDLFLNRDYCKAVEYLSTKASSIDEEIPYKKHKAMTIASWDIDLHGSLRSGLWEKLDDVIDEVQDDIFYNGRVRLWENGNTKVYLPNADEDIVIVFAHILQHFYRGGIGLRQVCDWCRLLWTFKDSIDKRLLEERIRKMGALSEWRSFAALAVNILGLPKEAMPFYSSFWLWRWKSHRILDLIMEMGNFGHSRTGYQLTMPVFARKITTLYFFTKDNIRQLTISPINPFRVWCNLIRIKLFNRYGEME